MKTLSALTLLLGSLFLSPFLATGSAAESFKLSLGERTLTIAVPKGCSFKNTGAGNYSCKFETKRNPKEGAFDEATEIIVSSVEVPSEEIMKFGKKMAPPAGQSADTTYVTSLAEASQAYIRQTDHKANRLMYFSLINQLDDLNSAPVSRGEAWGGSDCRIFTTAIVLTLKDQSRQGVERGGMRCILWSYTKPRADKARTLDVLIEVREYDDFKPQGPVGFQDFWLPIISKVKFR